DNPAAILAARGRFAIVEGKVLSVRDSGGTVYLNFGRRWTEDFTVTILKRITAKFVAAGIDPKKLEGRRVRVCGYVEERGGPWIEAAMPEQIEIADGR
ncbi:MAG: thermonuclease family protein, partial [Xanthobacteraceae bacterium]